MLLKKTRLSELNAERRVFLRLFFCKRGDSNLKLLGILKDTSEILAIFVQTDDMAEHNETGKEGELEACAWLRQNGFRIIQTNWRWHHYELDIIALQGKELVVIEVKTRSANYLLPPEKAVTKAKIKRIVAATDAYIRYKNIDVDIRFDVIIVIKKKNGHQIEHIEDAFYAPVNQ